VMFLASDEADFVTGTNLIVAGGWKIQKRGQATFSSRRGTVPLFLKYKD